MVDAGLHAYASFLKLRYQESYDDAKALNKFGKLMRGLGIALSAIVIVGIPFFYSVYNAASTGAPGVLERNGSAGISLLPLCLAYGLFILFIFLILGTALSSMGQILEATTDTAVNTSPMLTIEQKAEIVLHKNMLNKSLHDTIENAIAK